MPPEWHAEARVLKDADPALTYTEIGRRLGRTHSAVYKALHPERQREYIQTAEARPGRREEKTAWDLRERREHRAECANPVCKNLRGLLTPSERRKPGLCMDCVHAIADVRRTLAEGMWAEGWPLKDLSVVFGGVTRAYFVVGRERGWDLPYRYKGTKRQRLAA